ncbi:MAG: serine/threonine-protein phosphatase [Planctomycetota bacterium]|nr:serine/threonine-protein phosphatase [Planctomycetota bacterium]
MTGPAGSLHLLEEEMAEHVIPTHAGMVYAYSARCPGKQRPNEDGAAVLPFEGGVLLVVADGLGGQPGADQASGLAIRALQRGFRVAAGGEHPRDTILSSLEAANQAILDLGIGAGTTIAVAELSGSKLRTYHVGDSIVMVIGASGEVRSVTTPHSPIGYAVAAGLLDEEQALRHPDRHIISNMVGSREMRVELGSPMDLVPTDSVLVASDGVTDNLRTGELIELVRGGTVERAGQHLIEACRARMDDLTPRGGAPSKPDDLTCLLYRGSSDFVGRPR